MKTSEAKRRLRKMKISLNYSSNISYLVPLKASFKTFKIDWQPFAACMVANDSEIDLNHIN